MHNLLESFITGIQNTTWLEYVAVFFGIASVLFSRKEHILVYPTGLVNTILYTWFCFFWWDLYAEASLNFYYTVMSIYGWVLWARRRKSDGQHELQITRSTNREWHQAILFFSACWAILYLILKTFTDSKVPIADSFASAAAYAGMWLMARKKLENWLWWILTNIASIPLYFYKQAVFTSVQYLVLLVLAIMGYISWNRKIKQAEQRHAEI
ncbi:MAG: nicotinamide riboside transporter PnuC [Chitinophagaceae bacterium]|nr:MAG: nicotinamide riboside transporter PnuC [Chitinophagaceae bacterium]